MLNGRYYRDYQANRIMAQSITKTTVDYHPLAALPANCPHNTVVNTFASVWGGYTEGLVDDITHIVAPDQPEAYEIDNQTLFDIALNGIEEQGGFSFRPNDHNDDISCLYRAPNGNKCAFGHVIPDDRYEPFMDDERLNTNRVIRFLDIDVNKALSEDLQDAHDRAANVSIKKGLDHAMEHWRERMKEIAKDYSLDYPNS